MADTNGNVAAQHLVAFRGVQVSRALFPNLQAAADDFSAHGVTFGIAKPGGGMRPSAMQTAMRADYQAGRFQQPPYYLSSPPSPIPAPAGQSRHGFGLAVDVITNATVALRNELMARHGFHLWSSSDPNHFEPNWLNVLAAPPESAFAGGGSTPIEEDDLNDDQDARLRRIEMLLGAGGLNSIADADTMYAQLKNVNDQVTGAHNFDAKVGPSVAGRLVTTQQAVQVLLDRPVGMAASVDVAALSAAVSKAVTEAIAATDNPSAETIAKAVDAALADNFAAVPTAVVKAEGAALANG